MERATGRKDGEAGAAVLAALPDVRVLGVSVFDPVWARLTHRDSDAELLCVLRGRMALVLPGRRHPLGAGDFALVPPATPHRDAFAPGEEPVIFLVQFRWRAAAAFFRAVSMERIAALRADDRDEALRMLGALRDHAGLGSPLDRTLARSLLHGLLLHLWRAVLPAARDRPEEGGGPDRRRALMMRARHYLDRHYGERQSLDRLAAHLRVSPYYLSRVFSRESGFSMTDYLTSVRMQQARALLQAGAGNVSEVGYRVGYESPAYFSRAFKRYFGMPPSAVAPGEPAGAQDRA